MAEPSAESIPSGTDIAKAFCKEVLTPEFFDKHWEKFPFHRSAAKYGKTANRLPDALSVEQIMTLMRHSGSNLKMFRRGEPYDMDNFLIAYLDGASLIVNQADRCNGTLYTLCRVLAKLHFHHVFAVAYLTPPHSQAVRLHNDDQDVFLFQVWGKKKWVIRNAPQLLPYTEEMLGKDSVVPPQLIKEPVLEFTMEPYDVLYIPRGYLHEANTGDGEPSLHITVTMPTSDYCWGVQLVKHFLHTLNSDRSVSKSQQDLFSASVSELGSKMDDEALDGFMADLLKVWSEKLSADSILDSFDQRMSKTNDSQEKAYANFEHINSQPEASQHVVSEASRVRLMYGIHCKIDSDNESAVFTRATDKSTLEIGIKKSAAPLIRNLGSKPKRVTELPCEDVFERLCVLQLLLHHGVIQLVTRGAEDESSIPE